MQDNALEPASDGRKPSLSYPVLAYWKVSRPPSCHELSCKAITTERETNMIWYGALNAYFIASKLNLISDISSGTEAVHDLFPYKGDQNKNMLAISRQVLCNLIVLEQQWRLPSSHENLTECSFGSNTRTFCASLLMSVKVGNWAKCLFGFQLARFHHTCILGFCQTCNMFNKRGIIMPKKFVRFDNLWGYPETPTVNLKNPASLTKALRKRHRKKKNTASLQTMEKKPLVSAVSQNASGSGIDNQTVIRRSWKHEIYGFLFGLLASLLLATSTGCVRAMQQTIPDIEASIQLIGFCPLWHTNNKILFLGFCFNVTENVCLTYSQLNGFRFTTVFLTTLPYFLYMRITPEVHSTCGTWCWVVTWSVTGIVSSLLHYVAVVYISLGKVISLVRFCFPSSIRLIAAFSSCAELLNMFTFVLGTQVWKTAKGRFWPVVSLQGGCHFIAGNGLLAVVQTTDSGGAGCGHRARNWWRRNGLSEGTLPSGWNPCPLRSVWRNIAQQPERTSGGVEWWLRYRTMAKRGGNEGGSFRSPHGRNFSCCRSRWRLFQILLIFDSEAAHVPPASVLISSLVASSHDLE